MRKSALLFICFCLGLVVFQGRTLAEEVKIPNRIGKAKPGEWASYKMASVIRKFIVSGFEEKDGARHVVLRSQTLLNNDVMNEKESGHPVSDASILTKNIDATKATQREEVIEINGKKIKVGAISAQKDGVPVTVYVSEEIPVFGLVRMDMFGEMLFEIHEYGFGEGE